MKQKLPSALRSVSISLTILMLWIPLVHAQTVKIMGKVTDASTKLPLAGATVQVKGTTVGVTSDLKGLFQINAPAKAELVVSFIGYETQTISVGDRKNITVALREATNSLEQVVVIGYGSLAKRDVTASITSISANEIEAKVPIDIFDALQGMAAGLNITRTSGEPGADADVRIRGTSTFDAGTLPLYIVDGMPMDDIASINPQDIASVEILKDAASASIYGSRAANGVIIITTKKGTAGRPKINVRYTGGVSWISHLIPLTTPDMARWYDRERNRIATESPVNPYTGQNRYSYSPVSLVDSLKNFYNYSGNIDDLIFRPAYKNQVDLSLGGASEKMNYYISAGFLDEQGVVVNSSNKRISTRINTEYRATDRFTIRNRTNLSVTKQNGIDEGSLVSSMYDWLPYWNPIDMDGNPIQVIGGKSSPYTVARERTRKTDNYRVGSIITGEFKFNKYFKFTSNLSADFRLKRYFDYVPQVLTASNKHTTGQDRSNLSYNYLNENYFNYDRKIKNHNMSFTLGMSAQSWRDERMYLYGEDYSSDLIYTLNAASRLDLSNTYTRIEEHSMMSFFFRGQYSYKGKYLASATLRYDGSSRFGPDKRWGLFPAATFGWRLSDEKFMNWAKPALNDAKLRFSYGVTGNESIGNYDSWPRYFSGDPTTNNTNKNYHNNGAYGGAATVMGIAPIHLAYEGLGWEETSQMDIGLDLTLLKNRLTIAFDYYEKKTTDLLYNVEVPKETGYTRMRKNVGAMDNKGFELSISYRVINSKNWTWNFGFNGSHNNTVIKKLADGVPFYAGSNSAIYVYEGARLGEIWGYKHNGVFAYDESNAFDHNWNQLSPVFKDGAFAGYTLNGVPYTSPVNRKVNASGDPFLAGDVNWLDSPANAESQKGQIDENDKVKLGCAQPDFFGGFNTTIRYKNFSLYADIYYSIGGDIYNYTRYQRNSFSTTVRAPEHSVLENMWRRPGDVSTYPVPMARPTFNAIGTADYWVEDGSYVKLRTVKLTYTLPKSILKKTFLRSAQVYIYGNNLMTWSKYKGFDPEFGGSSPLAFGIDTGRYPRKLEIGFGLNLGF